MKNFKERFRRIYALIKHKIAFFKVEKKTFHRHTWRGFTHDLDKLIMYLLPFSTSFVRRYHKKHSRHHNPKSLMDYYERLVDVECAKYTKIHSELSVREYIEYAYTAKDVEYHVLYWLADIYGV